MQAIYAVSLTLELASDDLDSSPQRAKAGLERAVDQLHDVVRDIRSYIFDLRPREYHGDLAAALTNLCNEFRENSQIDASIRLSDGFGQVPDTVGVTLYLIAHEALSNVRKHAAADSVEILVMRTTGAISMQVRDSGRGFDSSAEHAESHRGLRNIVARVQAIDGRVDIESALGQGTCVSVQVPLQS
jgi:signal transduction histidine kinase